MLYSVTHTATPLHVIRSGTSPNVLLSSLLHFQFKTSPHRQSESETNTNSVYIFEACTSHQCSQHKEMNCQHDEREFSKNYCHAHGTEITHLVSDWKELQIEQCCQALNLISWFTFHTFIPRFSRVRISRTFRTF